MATKNYTTNSPGDVARYSRPFAFTVAEGDSASSHGSRLKSVGCFGCAPIDVDTPRRNGDRIADRHYCPDPPSMVLSLGMPDRHMHRIYLEAGPSFSPAMSTHTSNRTMDRIVNAGRCYLRLPITLVAGSAGNVQRISRHPARQNHTNNRLECNGNRGGTGPQYGLARDMVRAVMSPWSVPGFAYSIEQHDLKSRHPFAP